MAALTFWSGFWSPPKESVIVSIVFPSVFHEVMGLDAMIFVFWMFSFFLFCFFCFKFYFIFKLYITVLSQLFHSSLSLSSRASALTTNDVTILGSRASLKGGWGHFPVLIFLDRDYWNWNVLKINFFPPLIVSLK